MAWARCDHSISGPTPMACYLPPRLAAGTAGNLQTKTNPYKQGDDKTFDYFDPNLSHISFDYRLVTPWGGLDSGASAFGH